MWRTWLTRKYPDARKDWEQEENRMTEDEMVGWHHWLDVWVSSESWWWTGKPGMLQSMGSERVGHDWVTELNWTASILGERKSWLRIYFSSKLFCKQNSRSSPRLTCTRVHGFCNLSPCLWEGPLDTMRLNSMIHCMKNCMIHFFRYN